MATSRREFLSAFRKPLIRSEESEPLVLRPPYGSLESLFLTECLSCESKACIASCDEKIILLREDGTPTLNFSKSGCTFCEACAIACSGRSSDVEVLSLNNVQNAEQLNARFKISLESCVAHHGVICFSCKEPCIDDAILFNGMFNPVIDTDKCTACGFCLGRCPTNAISFTVLKIEEEVL
ncbi:MAG: Ferredoxin-type protein NapF (periplasmic nitrate reductase) [uncultured Sulfurovum sp.]|uniref:Ferredoxin-type protein NapF (Periplasmic nitrate reductase) n=1 Tax=uncultured Sulfurovum sp. TaxID=269237 RepID=A0A6S6SQV6_9BACT|nr:MAG: Ferredoxin-type protein NapF (periplasmic nitrate reductase) [uncultured Sulfurovum sp.]